MENVNSYAVFFLTHINISYRQRNMKKYFCFAEILHIM